MDFKKNYSMNDLYLRLSYWFVSHKKSLRKWWVMTLLIIDVILIVYILINGLIISIQSSSYDNMVKEMSLDFIDNNYRQEAKPGALTIIKKKAIKVGSSKYDYVAEIKNNNLDWGANSFNYKFIDSEGKETEESSSFINPDQKKYIALENVNYDGDDVSKLDLEITNIDWKRITNKSLLEELNFEVSNEKISKSQTSEGVASIVTADISNQSFYGFWQVNVPVVILHSDEPIAYDIYRLRNLKSFEDQSISVSWLKNLPLSAEIIIEPHINIFDESNFISN